MTARVVPDDEAGRALAINVLCRGGIVAMPTDTVYGVGVTLKAEHGLERLFAAKDRPLDKAIVLLLAEAAQAEEVGVMAPVACALAEAFWPGGLTLVISQVSGSALPDVLTAGQSTIGVRMPAHDCPRSLAREFGPLPVTSANISGQPPATTAPEVFAQLGERIDLILDGGPARGGVPSTVVDCSTDQPRLLRQGAIGPGDLFDVLSWAGDPDPHSSTAVAVRALGIDAAVEAAKRLAERVASGGDFDGPDFWAFLLGMQLGQGDPELGWEYVCRLVDAVADQEAVLSLVGAGWLEDFCWFAAPAFIDRIVERARLNDAFRAALGEVWPGGADIPAGESVPEGCVAGPRIPPEIYARIRSAAAG